MTNVQAAKPELTVAINANGGLGMPATIRQARQSRLPGKLKSAVGRVAPSGFYPQGLSGLARPLAAIFRPRPAPPGTTRHHPRHPRHPRHLLDEYRAAARARRAARAAAHRRRQGIARPDPAGGGRVVHGIRLRRHHDRRGGPAPGRHQGPHLPPRPQHGRPVLRRPGGRHGPDERGHRADRAAPRWRGRAAVGDGAAPCPDPADRAANAEGGSAGAGAPTASQYSGQPIAGVQAAACGGQDA